MVICKAATAASSQRTSSLFPYEVLDDVLDELVLSDEGVLKLHELGIDVLSARRVLSVPLRSIGTHVHVPRHVGHVQPHVVLRLGEICELLLELRQTLRCRCRLAILSSSGGRGVGAVRGRRPSAAGFARRWALSLDELERFLVIGAEVGMLELPGLRD
jgi:hypothetical protein